MGAIHLSEEVQRLIERKVAEGHASSPAAFVEEAVLRMVEEDDEPLGEAMLAEIERVAAEGIADMEAGRYVTIATPEDEAALRERLAIAVRRRLERSEDAA